MPGRCGGSLSPFGSDIGRSAARVMYTTRVSGQRQWPGRGSADRPARESETRDREHPRKYTYEYTQIERILCVL